MQSLRQEIGPETARPSLICYTFTTVSYCGVGKRGHQAGLTIIETMLALIMLSLLIVGVLGLLGSLLVASTKSTDMTAGTFVGQYVFEEAKLAGPPSPSGGIRDGEKKIFSHEEQLPLTFKYRENWTLVGERETYTVGGEEYENQFGASLYHVEVQVWWMVNRPDQNDEDAVEEGRAEGGGRRTVILERLISFAPEATE
jgi:hypothetical protein